MGKIWPDIKLGAVPFVVISALLFLTYEVWGVVNSWGLHLVGKKLFDVPISISILLALLFFLGRLVRQPTFNQFAKENFIKIPVIGGLLLLLFLPKHELRLIETKTVYGTMPAEESWEYALVTKDLGEEGGVKWYRVHTLGWTGKLFSRVGEKNVRLTGKPDKDVWMTVLSMGLL